MGRLQGQAPGGTDIVRKSEHNTGGDLGKKEKKNMTFIYPAVLTPHKENEGYHVTFPDLVGCEADGPDLQDALENARAAAYDWVCVELEEDDPDMPEVTHEEDILLDEGSFVRQIMIIVKLLPDYD